MCECGCSMGNPAYRLPINRTSCYVVELYPGCDYCSAPPAVIVRKVDRSSVFWDELQEAPLLPLTKVDDYTEAAIRCGPDPDEFRKEARPLIVGYPTDRRKALDGDDADVMTDEIWKAVLRKMPQVIEYAREG